MTASRRKVLGGAAAITAAGAMGANTAVASEGGATFLLVHGAWHGGWCWRDVVPHLRAAGHGIYAPSMTGLGDRAHLASPDINLTTHITDIVNIIEYEELSDVILVGHSYGGVVISGVADQVKDRIAHLMFLDAVLNPTGTSQWSEETIKQRSPEAYESRLLPVADWDFLGIPEDHPSLPWMEERLVPHPVGTLTEIITYVNGGTDDLPKTYVRCTLGRMTNGEEPWQGVFDQAPDEWTYLTLETGHDLMVTAPKETADILLSVV